MAEEISGDFELPLDTVGKRLQRAREAAGLSRADVAAQTRIAERHLAAIDEERFGDFASSTYAVGFARAYARSVGLDEFAIAREVRAEIAGTGEEPRHSGTAFEPGDPARVPPSRMAWLAGLAALGIIIAVFVLWRSFFVPSVSLPDLTTDEAPVAAASAPAAGPSAPAIDPRGEVVFTALAEGVWVKFYDASGAQLMQKQMALGERYAVPAAAQGPQVWTARPDALAITVGGRAVPPLADRQVTVKDMPVSAAALLARTTPAAPVAPAPIPAAPVQPAALAPAVAPPPARAAAQPATLRPAAPRRVEEAARVEAVSPPPVAVETSTVSN